MNDLFEILFPKPSYCIQADVNIIMIRKENYIFGLIEPFYADHKRLMTS